MDICWKVWTVYSKLQQTRCVELSCGSSSSRMDSNGTVCIVCRPIYLNYPAGKPCLWKIQKENADYFHFLSIFIFKKEKHVGVCTIHYCIVSLAGPKEHYFCFSSFSFFFLWKLVMVVQLSLIHIWRCRRRG